ncbi:hypothetical protein C2G38_2191326 [Gigaspora rosea]|uniref:Uncharacterized protein n=1 Tax=Gigaspora rosea TaxID=44941 RepID=A0A397V3I2_9GLOM|nr:hypothetical protein C2G38_2191326 [Gigaspora rosea]
MSSQNTSNKFQRKISSTSGNNANPLSPSSSSSSTPDNVFVQQEFIDGRSLPNTAVRPKRKHTSNDDSKRRRDVASIDSDFTESANEFICKGKCFFLTYQRCPLSKEIVLMALEMLEKNLNKSDEGF